MIYAISDLHLDITKEKDMNVFGGNWNDYENRIFKNWEKINDDDLVLIPGDISWAMSIKDAFKDLYRIDMLKGQKILLKGNHDYWWSSISKLNNLDLPSIHFLQNTSFVYKGVKICGTRGWNPRDYSDFNSHDEKIFQRELLRMELSLSHKVDESFDEIIVMMHYPPFNKDNTPNEYEDLFKKYKVTKVIYGHIHGEHANHLPKGLINGIEYFCSSGDYINFDPILIKE